MAIEESMAWQRTSWITTQLLHAYQLKFGGLEGNFAYLNGKTVKAKLPEEFQEALQKLGFTDKDLEAFA